MRFLVEYKWLRARCAIFLFSLVQLLFLAGLFAFAASSKQIEGTSMAPLLLTLSLLQMLLYLAQVFLGGDLRLLVPWTMLGLVGHLAFIGYLTQTYSRILSDQLERWLLAAAVAFIACGTVGCLRAFAFARPVVQMLREAGQHLGGFLALLALFFWTVFAL